MERTSQKAPKTRLAYCASFRSSGQSGKPSRLSRACFQIYSADFVIKIRRRALHIRESAKTSTGARYIKICHKTLWHITLTFTEWVYLMKNVKRHFDNIFECSSTSSHVFELKMGTPFVRLWLLLALLRSNFFIAAFKINSWRVLIDCCRIRMNRWLRTRTDPWANSWTCLGKASRFSGHRCECAERKDPRGCFFVFWLIYCWRVSCGRDPFQGHFKTT